MEPKEHWHWQNQNDNIRYKAKSAIHHYIYFAINAFAWALSVPEVLDGPALKHQDDCESYSSHHAYGHNDVDCISELSLWIDSFIKKEDGCPCCHNCRVIYHLKNVHLLAEELASKRKIGSSR